MPEAPCGWCGGEGCDLCGWSGDDVRYPDPVIEPDEDERTR